MNIPRQILLLVSLVAGFPPVCPVRAAEPPKEVASELKWAAAVDSNAPFAFYDAHNRLTGFEY